MDTDAIAITFMMFGECVRCTADYGIYRRRGRYAVILVTDLLNPALMLETSDELEATLHYNEWTRAAAAVRATGGQP